MRKTQLTHALALIVALLLVAGIIVCVFRWVRDGFGEAGIDVTLPANTKVASPVTILGRARGQWFFEATFPVELLDSNDKVLARGQAHAQGEWMTHDPVPFYVILTFTSPATSTGTLRLHKANPSGLGLFDEFIEIPVRF